MSRISLTDAQRRTLAGLIRKNPEVLERNTDYVTCALKRAVWDRITKEFNRIHSEIEPKKVSQLKRVWEYMRHKVKRNYNENRTKKRNFSGNTSRHDDFMDTVASVLHLDCQKSCSCEHKNLDESVATAPDDSFSESEEETRSQNGDSSSESTNNASTVVFSESNLRLQKENGKASVIPSNISLEDSTIEYYLVPPEKAGSGSVGSKQQVNDKEVGTVEAFSMDNPPLLVPVIGDSQNPPDEESGSTVDISVENVESVPESSMTSQNAMREPTMLDSQDEAAMDVVAKRLLLKSLRLDIKAKELQCKVLRADLKNKEMDSAIKKCKLENMQLEKKRLEGQIKCIPLFESACEKFAEMAKNVGDAGFLAQKAAFLSFGLNK